MIASERSGNLTEILDKGIVIDAWARVSVVGLELVGVEARVVIASIESYLAYSRAIAATPTAAPVRLADVRAPPKLIAPPVNYDALAAENEELRAQLAAPRRPARVPVKAQGKRRAAAA